jgi:hypothetical protein
MNQAWVVGAFVAALWVAMPARAVVAASVAVQAPRLEVVDLNPGDGIPAAWAEDSSAWAATFSHRFYFDLRDNVPAPEAEGDGSFSLGLGAISGSATAPDSYFYVGDALYPEQQTLRVTPFTRLTVSVPYRLDIVLQPEQAWGSHPPKALASLELGGAAHREAVDAQRGLAHAHRHALAFFAAGAHAAVERQVVADHADFLSDSGPLPTRWRPSPGTGSCRFPPTRPGWH